MEDAMDGPDLRLWRACAGLTVRIPPVGSRVYYFPQGHAEHASSMPMFPPDMLPAFPCHLDSVKFQANRDTDEVFAEFGLGFFSSREAVGGDLVERGGGLAYSKVLTQSDANNGGGFSVPRQCADSIFPPLDFTADPPVQNINVHDVHGSMWQFRHIYRGTPRRHLLTTGWSKFVNSKKLIAGDSIIFVRANSGEIFVGIRRFIDKGSTNDGGVETPRWTTPFRDLQRSKDITEVTPPTVVPGSLGFCRKRGRFSAASVVEAATRATSKQAFQVVYYPKMGMPEYCVVAEAVEESMKVQWTPGLKFRMEVESEDSSRTTWCNGTISTVSVLDPVSWPDSAWKMLEVTWDEPETLPNIKRVSPWEIELVSSMPHLSIPAFSFPKKKSRTLDNPEPHVGRELAAGGDGVMGNMMSSVNYKKFPAGMQGARHDLMFASSFLDFLPIKKTQHGPYMDPQFLHSTLPTWNYGSIELNTHKFTNLEQYSPKVRSGVKRCNGAYHRRTGHIENHAGNQPKGPKIVFQLFGATIQTQLNADSFDNEANHGSQNVLNIISTKQLFENNLKGRNSQYLESEPHDEYKKRRFIDLLGGGNYDDPFMINKQSMVCKVYKEAESDAPGRAVDLSTFCSYEQLYKKLSKMFDMEECQLLKRVFYKGNTGSLRYLGEEPFREFAMKVRKLTIV